MWFSSPSLSESVSIFLILTTCFFGGMVASFDINVFIIARENSCKIGRAPYAVRLISYNAGRASANVSYTDAGRRPYDMWPRKGKFLKIVIYLLIRIKSLKKWCFLVCHMTRPQGRLFDLWMNSLPANVPDVVIYILLFENLNRVPAPTGSGLHMRERCLQVGRAVRQRMFAPVHEGERICVSPLVVLII